MAFVPSTYIIPGLYGPFFNAGAPSGTTYAGVAAKGAKLTDTTNGIEYQNQGTQASPSWVKVGLES